MTVIVDVIAKLAISVLIYKGTLIVLDICGRNQLSNIAHFSHPIIVCKSHLVSKTEGKPDIEKSMQC